MALWTGFTFVGYFTPIRELALAFAAARARARGRCSGCCFYGFATYGNAGCMREQVCKYMCPYARFQSAMFDKDTLIVTYDAAARRAARLARAQRRPGALGLGDCIDCTLCVQVCPTGIDIRKGLQYECIGCAACIDACNGVMDKMGYAARPDPLRHRRTRMAQRLDAARRCCARVLRPRVLVYSASCWR